MIPEDALPASHHVVIRDGVDLLKVGGGIAVNVKDTVQTIERIPCAPNGVGVGQGRHMLVEFLDTAVKGGMNPASKVEGFEKFGTTHA